MLHPIAELDHDKYRQLSGALASAANISTGVSEAQTGQINKTYSLADGSSVTVNLRVEAVTAIHGIDVVLRLFNFKPEMLHLDKLGLEVYEQEAFRDIIKHPNGLVLIVGPTGSQEHAPIYPDK